MSMRRLASIATSLPVRILVSVGLLAAVAASIDWDGVGHALENASWGLIVVAVLCYFAAFVVASIRWHALLNVADVEVSYRDSLRAYLIGMFANNLLPSGYGGDAVRAWVVAGTGKPLARSLTSVIVDRASALACLLILAWVAALVKADKIPLGIIVLLGLATGMLCAGALVALVIARRRGLGRFLPDAVRPYTAEIANVIRAYEHDRRLLAEIVGIGLVYQGLVLTAFWLIAEALGLHLDPFVLAVVVPPVLMAALLPISLAGFGVREGAFVVLLGEFGVSAADATLLSLLAVACVAIASAPGGVAIALQPRGERSTRPAGATLPTGSESTLP